MSTFKAALRVAAHHPIYICVYLVGLSLMGLFVILSAFGNVALTTHDSFDARVAVVDQDNSELSHAIYDKIGEDGTIVEVGDSDFALQDALATSQVNCIVVIPEGFGDDFAQAAKDGGELPALQIASGTRQDATALVSTELSAWLRLIGADMALQPEASVSDIVDNVASAADESVETRVVANTQTTTGASAFGSYLTFSSYALCSSVVVCAGVVFSTLADSDLRRRMLASPITPRETNASTLGAGIVMAVVAWAVTCGVGILGLMGYLTDVTAGQVALAVLAMLAYAMVPLAVAFLLSQFSASEDLINAIGNILGMVMSFLGGAWISLDLMSDGMRTAAMFSPSYWLKRAVDSALTTPNAQRIAADVGIILLFAAAIALVGIAVGRARRQTATA
ncbi:MAG: ABC transporter permease [Tractidigestivibacter sp.]|jgi:ABC-2 type transport system permease protein|uniref:ABC transporter permease n=1 Tax=Tractidigestivibacter sp. TaxID=2847320 RepID=UPI003D8A9C79